MGERCEYCKKTGTDSDPVVMDLRGWMHAGCAEENEYTHMTDSDLDWDY